MKRVGILMALLLPVTLLLGLGYAVNGRVQAKPQLIDVGGVISTDTSWTADNSPYIITDTVTVQAGVTLTIEAGVTVMFEAGSGQHMEVEGHLEVAGTAVNPVIITSAENPPTDRWIGINVTSGSANFVHTTLRDAETPLFVFSSVGGDVFLQNSTIEENSVFPVFVSSDALHRLKMDNVNFSNNQPNRIAVELNSASGEMASLSGDVILTPQPGLEAYEVIEGVGSFSLLHVPQGITLTLAAGTVVLLDNVIFVDGRLEANGTELEPVIFDEGFDATGYYLFFTETGSASLVHTTVQNASNVAVGIGGQSDQPVILQDVLLTGTDGYPIVTEAPSLHRLQMTNVTFQNNLTDRVYIDPWTVPPAITRDVTLTTQPGLAGYTFKGGYNPSIPAPVEVPNGLTLTVEPGVELRFGEGAETLVVNGHLQAIGTSTQPITFTSEADSTPGEWQGITLAGGSANLAHAIVRNSTEAILVGALDADDLVEIEDSVIQSSSTSPLGIPADALHQLSLNNVTFSDNQNGNHIVVYENGTLAGDVTLLAQPGLAGYVFLDSPTSQLIVPDGLDLTLNQGAILKFMGSNQELLVQGNLQTTGTSLQPVLLTSFADSAPNQWGGVVVENGTARLDYAEVRYATYNVTVNNTAVSTPVLIQNSQIHSGEQVGLWVQDGAVTAVCSRFANTNGSGVLVGSLGNPDVKITSSALVGNADAGLRNDSIAEVDARHSWWGDATGPAGIGPGSGDAVLGNVLFAPWLEEDTCTTVSYALYLPFVATP